MPRARLFQRGCWRSRTRPLSFRRDIQTLILLWINAWSFSDRETIFCAEDFSFFSPNSIIMSSMLPIFRNTEIITQNHDAVKFFSKISPCLLICSCPHSYQHHKVANTHLTIAKVNFIIIESLDSSFSGEDYDTDFWIHYACLLWHILANLGLQKLHLPFHKRKKRNLYFCDLNWLHFRYYR